MSRELFFSGLNRKEGRVPQTVQRKARIYPSPELCSPCSCANALPQLQGGMEGQGHGETSGVMQSVIGPGCAEHNMAQGLQYEGWRYQCKLL